MRTLARLALLAALALPGLPTFAQTTATYTLVPSNQSGELYIFGWAGSQLSVSFTIKEVTGPNIGAQSSEFFGVLNANASKPFPDDSLIAQDGADGKGTYTYTVGPSAWGYSNGIYTVMYPTENGGRMTLSMTFGALCTGCRRGWWHLTSAAYSGPEF